LKEIFYLITEKSNYLKELQRLKIIS